MTLSSLLSAVGDAISRVKGKKRKAEPKLKLIPLRAAQSSATMRSSMSSVAHSTLQTRHYKRGAFTFFSTGNHLFSHYTVRELKHRNALEYAPPGATDKIRYEKLTAELWDSAAITNDRKQLWNLAAAQIRNTMTYRIVSEEQMLKGGGMVGWTREYRKWARETVDEFIADKWMASAVTPEMSDISTITDSDLGSSDVDSVWTGRVSSYLSHIDEGDEPAEVDCASENASTRTAIAVSSSTIRSPQAQIAMERWAVPEREDAQSDRRVSAIKPGVDPGFEDDADSALTKLWRGQARDRQEVQEYIGQFPRSVSPLTIGSTHTHGSACTARATMAIRVNAYEIRRTGL